MPTSKELSQKIASNILKTRSLEDVEEALKPKYGPTHSHFPRQTDLTKSAQKKRIEVLEKQGLSLPYMKGKTTNSDPSIYEGNIENFIGLTQIPTGIIGPLRINGLNACGDFTIPLSTTEGALVASYNRGAKIITMSGGATTMCLKERISRAPGFTFSNISQASQFIVWCVNQFDQMQEIVSSTTSHGKLENINATLTGNQVYLNLEYTTGDASGQNMVTIASDAICQYILKHSPLKPKLFFLESNMSGDKKATALSYLSVRGKKVTSEVTIPRKIIQKFLHTTPEMMMEYWKMSFVGGVQSGSLGVQGHFANALAAIFLSCGQDVACVSEASTGLTRVDVTEGGDFYISVTLPNLIVGTVGGGTSLPTQNECLSLLGCTGTGTAKKFAEICTATVLAGEISITGALAGGYFSKSHESYGRKKSRNNRK
ncbi:MAG: hypothetical protein S4CHLAM7_06000 [Chlamydiae bacterium]|nr:hypothetical protein [Chlamydiota bacterium]